MSHSSKCSSYEFSNRDRLNIDYEGKSLQMEKDAVDRLDCKPYKWLAGF